MPFGLMLEGIRGAMSRYCEGYCLWTNCAAIGNDYWVRVFWCMCGLLFE